MPDARRKLLTADEFPADRARLARIKWHRSRRARELEDIHMHIETAAGGRLGDVGRKLHGPQPQ